MNVGFLNSNDYRAQQCFGSLVSLLDKPAMLLDKTGQILCTSTRFNDVFGQQSHDLVGVTLRSMLDDHDGDAVTAYFGQCLAEPQPDTPPFTCAMTYHAQTADLSLSPLLVAGELLGHLCQANVRTVCELQDLMEHLDQGLWEYEVKTGRLVVSQAWGRMRGYAYGKTMQLTGSDWGPHVHPDDLVGLQKLVDKWKADPNNSRNFQYRYRHADGHWIWIIGSAKVIETDASGAPARIVGTDTDVTNFKEQEDEKTRLAEQLRLAVDASGIGVWEYDPNTNTLHWDDNFLEIYGLEDGQNERRVEDWKLYLHPDDRDESVAYSEYCQEHGLDFSRDYRILRPDGQVRHIRSRASQVAGRGSMPRLVGVNIDVTEDYNRTRELERVTAQLEYDSRHDALTGLANRRLLNETTAAFSCDVRPDQRFAVLHLDLDHFKAINDTLGHAAGDAVLVGVAQIIKSIVGDAGLVCRIGGDEFAVFFDSAPSFPALEEICADVVNALDEPILYQNVACKLGISVGCAIGRGQGNDLTTLFSQADSALYRAKEAGRNCYRMHAA